MQCRLAQLSGGTFHCQDETTAFLVGGITPKCGRGSEGSEKGDSLSDSCSVHVRALLIPFDITTCSSQLFVRTCGRMCFR